MLLKRTVLEKCVRTVAGPVIELLGLTKEVIAIFGMKRALNLQLRTSCSAKATNCRISDQINRPLPQAVLTRNQSHPLCARHPELTAYDSHLRTSPRHRQLYFRR